MHGFHDDIRRHSDGSMERIVGKTELHPVALRRGEERLAGARRKLSSVPQRQIKLASKPDTPISGISPATLIA
jgi:hypothetical protein